MYIYLNTIGKRELFMEIEKRNPKIYIMCGKAKHGKDTFSAYLSSFASFFTSTIKSVLIEGISFFAIKYSPFDNLIIIKLLCKVKQNKIYDIN